MPGTYRIGFIGDSITEGNANPGVDAAPVQCGPLLAAALGLSVAVTNRGVAGTTALDWAPAGTYFPDAVTAFASAGVTDVSIMLGANDCKSGQDVAPATYATRLGAIAASLVSSGFTVWLNYPSWCSWDVGSPTPNLAGYCTQIDGLANGTTILQGDTTAYAYFFAHQGELLDGVHPDPTGTASLARLWASAIAAGWLARKGRRPRVSFRGARLGVK